MLADLVGAPQEEVEAERARVALEGWGARLLAERSADRRWAQPLYSPKWTSTTYSLLLHWPGAPGAPAGTGRLPAGVLRGLEHFRAAGAATDPRLSEAVEVIRRARRPDGTWPVQRAYPGRTWFRIEAPGPSRWATLRALRVLQWWDQDAMSSVL